jgi:pyrroloquinoline quinone (PQQ) biosynthesis protein C
MSDTALERPDVGSPDEFIAELESIRAEWRKTHPFRIREIKSPDEFPRLAEAKRRRHAGGDDNHRFEGERYLNCTDKASRRMQLRKLVDEGGQTTVGGSQVSHPLLSRWESYAYGLTPDEVTALEKSDADPAELVRRGWWLHINRSSHFGVAIGSGLVVEGEHKLRSAELLAAIEEDRKRFLEWGIADVDRALENRHEHAGVDIDHADFNEDVVRQFVNTPELRDEMRRVFILRLQNFSGA